MNARILISSFAVAAIVAVGCSTTAGSGGQLDGTTWALTSYAAAGETRQVPDDVLADATFSATDSTVSGSAGCNRYTGPFTSSGSELTFGALATTQMACVGAASDVEAAYLANLAAARTFTATGEALTIYDEAGAAILEYAPAQPGAIGGVTWHATGINNGREAVVSVVAGTDPTAIYDPAGTVSGNTGCNDFSGPAVVDGASIAIGPLASTKMACLDEAASAQEFAFLMALENATTFEVRNQTLELRDADGAIQVLFATR
jgi:heat shock protein HslJ